MPMVEVDFETYKEIVNRRPSEAVSEGDVVRLAMGLSSKSLENELIWVSEGVRFPVGMELRHKFRDGRIATAEIVETGVKTNGRIFGGLSPAAAYGAGHQANGWQFWEYRHESGQWRKADSLRNGSV